MTDDPIVEEVHQARAKLLAEHGGTLAGYVDSLKRRQANESVEEPIRNVEELRRRTMRLAS